MRNPFKRQSRSAETPSLRERMAATREKFGRTLRVHRVLNAPAPTPAPAVDRAALVNYATFLAWEHNRVCAELYPHLGTKAVGFVLGMNAAERFFYGSPESHSDRPGLLPASSRAIAVLDLVGVDWRTDPPGDGIERKIGGDHLIDTGERPQLPEGWPAPDASLVMAAGDLLRLDAAIKALLSSDKRSAEETPGYTGLDEARTDALAVLSGERAHSLHGLQAKAHAILSPGLEGDPYAVEDLAQSLARDLLTATNKTIVSKPDPVFALIEEARRLMHEQARLCAVSGGLPDTHPLAEATAASHSAMWEHVRGVLLKTVPTTAAGCVALARFTVEFTNDQGVPVEVESNDPVLDLIARSPAR